MFYRIGPALGFVFVVLFSIGYFSFFIVPEGQQGVLFQFGKIIPPAKVEPGLYFKFPWRSVKLFEKRIINWDGSPNEINTREKNNIIVDTTARYRIIDPIKLRRSFVGMSEVSDRLGKVIVGATNKVVADHDLVETVRNTNEIIQRAKRDKLKIARDNKAANNKATKEETADEKLEAQKALELIADAEISGELEVIKVGREKLTQKIINLAAPELSDFGLELVDIQLKRVALEESVEKNVFTRMITEREKIVARIRAVGSRRREEILGETSEKLQKIESEAYRKVQEIKGVAEKVAIKTYADAVSVDPDFYEFYRSLEAYKKGLDKDTTFILSSEADFLKFLTDGPDRLFGK